MKEIQYEIVKKIAVLSMSDSGYAKEINLISWNGNEPKYDIRSFSPNREKCHIQHITRPGMHPISGIITTRHTTPPPCQ